LVRSRGRIAEVIQNPGTAAALDRQIGNEGDPTMMIVRVACVATCALMLAAANEPAPKAATSYVQRSTDAVTPGVAVILAAEDRGIKGTIAAYDAARQVKRVKYPANVAMTLLSAGPRLDSPDEVTVGTLTRD
jgi:hypothetical protein